MESAVPVVSLVVWHLQPMEVCVLNVPSVIVILATQPISVTSVLNFMLLLMELASFVVFRIVPGASRTPLQALWSVPSVM